MTVAELIKVASRFSPDTEVKVTDRHMIRPVVGTDVTIDMDTNKANMVLFVDEFKLHNKEE